MNHKIKRKWVAALRGGNWKQITGEYMDHDNGRCALGVLMEVDNGKRDAIHGGIANHIMQMNDFGRDSFSGIADWIEKNL